MANFVEELIIEAPPQTVWQALAAIGEIAAWNPGVNDSYLLTAQAVGIGAGRYCDLGGNSYLKEQVVRWEPPHALTMRVVDTDLPFERVEIHFDLTPADGATRVRVAPEYKLKFGLLGALLNRVYVRRTYQNGMAALLRGLKQYVEERTAA